MTLSTLFPFISFILVFILGFLVLKYAKESRVKLTFFIFSLFTAIWMFGTFMMFLNKANVDLILFWDRIVYVGVVFIPVAMLNFGLVLINKKTKNTQFLIWAGYLFSFIFLFLIPNKYFVDGVYIYSWGAHSMAGIFHNLFLVYFSVYIALWPIFVIRHYIRLSPSIEKERIKYSLVAFCQYIVLGPFGFLPAYGVDIFPFAYLSGLFFTIIMTYAIVTRRLMDIKLVLRKSTVYIISLVLTLVPPVVLKYLGLYFLPKYYGWIDIVLLMIAVSLFSVLRGRVYRFANKYLFTSLYDSKKVIAGLSEHLSTTLVAKRLFSFIYKSLRGAFHMKAMAVLTFDKKGENLLVSYNHGLEPSSKRIPVSEYTKIYDSFLKHDKIIIFDELKSLDVPIIKKFVKEFNGRLGVEVLVPLNVKDKAIGVIAFGAKESGDIYNQEDIEVLKVISSQVAIALENATLYEQTKKFNIKLTKEVSRATADLQQANTELRKLDEAKSEFISIASHQLRTPLTVIKGYVSMMLEGSFGKLAPTVDENLYKVYESNERLIHLVENLLNISRIESGRLQFNFAKEDLTDTVASVVEELSHTSEMKKIYLKYSPPKEQIMVDMDEEKIRQVVINLIDNAIKYTKKGGVTVSLQKQADKAYFCVSDSGMGIAEKDLPNLFKKFSRGKDTSIVHTEGTGLGLFVGKMMIEAHKGKIWAESKGTAQGSKFCFTIPLINKQPPKTLEGKVV